VQYEVAAHSLAFFQLTLYHISGPSRQIESLDSLMLWYWKYKAADMGRVETIGEIGGQNNPGP
jgi:hypothetical protein